MALVTSKCVRSRRWISCCGMLSARGSNRYGAVGRSVAPRHWAYSRLHINRQPVCPLRIPIPALLSLCNKGGRRTAASEGVVATAMFNGEVEDARGERGGVCGPRSSLALVAPSKAQSQSLPAQRRWRDSRMAGVAWWRNWRGNSQLAVNGRIGVGVVGLVIGRVSTR